MMRIFLAHVKAHLWCLVHFGQCILIEYTETPGGPRQVDRIEAGIGSPFDGTWQTAQVFYRAPSKLEEPV